MSLTNFKGTPGEFFINNSGQNIISANNGQAHQWQMANVCQVYGEDKEQREANAKLLCSSPLLAEALQDIVNFIQTYGIYDSSGKSLLEDIGVLEPQLAALKAAGL